MPHGTYVYSVKYLCKRATYTRQRALYLRKRAVYFRKRVYMTHVMLECCRLTWSGCLSVHMYARKRGIHICRHVCVHICVSTYVNMSTYVYSHV